jgi:hypothetical protein
VPNENLSDFLDLSKWKENQGFTSIYGIRCPWCGIFHLPPPHCPRGVMDCPRCKRTFYWHGLQTPAGFGWTSWQQKPDNW